MLNVEQIQLQGGADFSKYQSVKDLTQKIVSIPWLRVLRPLAEKAARVAELPGKLWFNPNPAEKISSEEGDQLTVISANLWHDYPRFRRIHARLEAFAQLVENHQADVLLLQEVARTADLWVDHWLAERLGMSFMYSRANGHQQGIGFEEGVAILSRYPLSRPVLRKLNPGSGPFVHRLAIGARIASPAGDLMAFSVHLGIKSKDNTAQANLLQDWVEGLAAESPAIVGGDFNAEESAPSIRQLKRSWLDTFRRINPLADGSTHEIHWPWGSVLRRARLDYIFLRAKQPRWAVVEARHLETPGGPHSDHRAVLLRLSPTVI